MRRVQLVDELNKAGVDRRFYHIEGVNGPFTGEGYEFAHKGDHWRISYYERGQETWGRSYEAESDACQAFVEELIRAVTPAPTSRPLTPEQIARAKRIRAEKLARHRVFLAEHGMLDK